MANMATLTKRGIAGRLAKTAMIDSLFHKGGTLNMEDAKMRIMAILDDENGSLAMLESLMWAMSKTIITQQMGTAINAHFRKAGFYTRLGAE